MRSESVMSTPCAVEPAPASCPATRLGKRKRHAFILGGCVLVAAATALALDQVLSQLQVAGTSGSARAVPAGTMDGNALFMAGSQMIGHAPVPIGAAAPDFSLPGVRDDRPVRLSDFRGRPVVLIFGSFGCNLLCEQAADLERLHARFKDRVPFLFVYVTEAPHINGALPPPYGGAGAADPASAQRERIRKGLAHYGLTMPCVEDCNKEAVAAYGAYPRRLVVVDAQGRVTYDAGVGPGGARQTADIWDLAAIGDHLDRFRAGTPAADAP